jgi:hypothetical protein
VVGDWTGGGETEIGIVRQQGNSPALWVLDTSGTGSYTASDPVFTYGLSSDHFLVGAWRRPAALYSGAGVLQNGAAPLADDATFAAAINQAVAAWQQAGLAAPLVQRLENADYRIGSLGNGLLGETIGDAVTIDATAQGYGWSEAPAPQPGRMDLETALVHEMGHILGLPDQTTQPDDVLFASLLPGVRKAPTTQDVDAVLAGRAANS